MCTTCYHSLLWALHCSSLQPFTSTRLPDPSSSQHSKTPTRIILSHTPSSCQAPDPSLIKEPKSLQDVRLYKLHREAPHKAFLLLK